VGLAQVMKFTETDLPGAYLVEPERIEDERGFFARTYCRREFEDHRLDLTLVQCSISFNRQRGTLRGMHYQCEPHAETKLVRCTRGAIYDVILDVRRGSPTFGRWVSAILGADNRLMLYVPEGVAHGFQTLEPDSEIFYQMSQFYSPDHARGIRWNDAAFSIEWPIASPIISERDRTHPAFVI
jgi:dTDP-4-dehydrorhamnose 3,5-epimerase